jgi:hypothetical protein
MLLELIDLVPELLALVQGRDTVQRSIQETDIWNLFISLGDQLHHCGVPKPQRVELPTFFFFFLVVLGFEIGALCLLGRCSTAWVTPLTLFVFISYLPNRVWLLCLDRPYLWLLCSWDDRCTPLHPPFYWLRWGLLNSPLLRGLTLNHSPDLCLPSSQVARITGMSH